MLKKILQSITSHKKAAAFVAVAVVAAGYFGYKNINKEEGGIRYSTSEVARGMITVSVSGSGQVAASNQVNIKSNVSGDVIYLGATNGQEVKTGTLLASIDSSDAGKGVRDAETALETAKLELDKLLEPTDELTLLKAENNLMQAKESKQKAEDNIVEAYEDSFNSIIDAFLDLPTVITEIRDILYSYEISDSDPAISKSWNISVLKNSISPSDLDERLKLQKFIDNAEDNYEMAREKYDENLENYRDANRYSDEEVIETLLEETLQTTKAIAETVKSEINMLDYWVDYRSQKDLRTYGKVTEYQSDLKSYTSKTNGHLTSLLSVQRSIQDNKESVLNAERSIKELELSLEELKAGADELDIRAKEISIQQKEDDLLDAQQTLADHYIRAPFNGIILGIDVQKGESVSANTVLASLITKQKVAEITLNEVDIVDIKTGQKAIISFDAIDDLSITGEVMEVDTLGTANQGVITYDVKIAFDTQDERVKPSMSISASIITNSRQKVLLAPNSAIKYQGDIQYVEIMGDDGAPVSKQVEIGLSNDTMTEIINGLKEGDEIVTQTVNSSSESSLNSGGFNPQGGGSMRMMRMP